jgi:hypothetical protein
VSTTFPGLGPNADIRQIVERVGWLLRGKMNAVTTVTLTANATTTTLTDQRIGGGTYIGLSPTTANAAGALGTTYISAKAAGSATITHANAASTDRTFDVLLIG